MIAPSLTSPAAPTTSDTGLAPVGCSTSIRFGDPSGTAATSAAGPSGSRHAVATLSAANTPMVACARCGMNERVQITPPSRGGATRNIFGTVFSVTSPRFIIGPTFRRIASTRAFSSASSSSASRVS